MEAEELAARVERLRAARTAAAVPARTTRRPHHVARAGRVAATGLSTSVFLGGIAVLAAASGPVATAPAVAAPTMTAHVERVFYVDENGNPVDPPTGVVSTTDAPGTPGAPAPVPAGAAASAAAPAALAPAPVGAPAPSGGTAAPPPTAAPTPTPAPTPTTAPPKVPSCTGSKC
jgi:hypothetical protein